MNDISPSLYVVSWKKKSYAMKEIHQGICIKHYGDKTLTSKHYVKKIVQKVWQVPRVRQSTTSTTWSVISSEIAAIQHLSAIYCCTYPHAPSHLKFIVVSKYDFSWWIMAKDYFPNNMDLKTMLETFIQNCGMTNISDFISIYFVIALQFDRFWRKKLFESQKKNIRGSVWLGRLLKIKSN